MTQKDDLDVLQHGAHAKRWGVRFPLFAVEWLKLTMVNDGGGVPALCTPGWKGFSVRLFGDTTFRRWTQCGITESPTRVVEITRSNDFTNLRLKSKTASFLQIRVGAKVSRSKMIEMCGDQVSAQLIERVTPKRGRDYPQVVVSGEDQDNGPSEEDGSEAKEARA